MIATLQKFEGSLWHTQGLHFGGLRAETIFLLHGMKKGQNGTIRRHEDEAWQVGVSF